MGELQAACSSHAISLIALFDSSPSLERCANEADTAVAFAARVGNDHIVGVNLVFRQLCRALQEESAAPGSFDSPAGMAGREAFDETTFPDSFAANPRARAFFHLHRAVSAALFDDLPGLLRHTAAASPLLPFVGTMYVAALGHLDCLPEESAQRIAKALPDLWKLTERIAPRPE